MTDTSKETAADDSLAESPENDWAAALAEQNDAQAGADPQLAGQAHAAILKPLEGDMILDIPVQLSVELGRTRLAIKDILQLGQGSIVELDGLAGQPMDIFVNGYLIAQGEVVVVDDKYGIRITDIVTPSDRISRLNGKR
jgi:flagellar motor switch protein FliN/FliY